MFDPHDKEMRKQLKGMSPHVTEPVSEEPKKAPPPPPPKKTPPKKYAGGGVTRADGCATKGHTKGRMV
jgi:hypothetical protein